jgi:hypothetical protein
MSDLPQVHDAAASILSRWPIVEGFFIIVITFLGVAAWRRGEKDSKSAHGGTGDVSTMLIQHDAAKSVGEIEREVEKQTAILMDIAKSAEAANRGQQHTHRILTEIMTNQALGLPLERTGRGHDTDTGASKRRVSHRDNGPDASNRGIPRLPDTQDDEK